MAKIILAFSPDTLPVYELLTELVDWMGCSEKDMWQIKCLYYRKRGNKGTNLSR